MPANKPIGAGAFQRALLQSLNSRAVALVVPPSLDLGPIYIWVLVLQSEDDTTTRFGVIQILPALFEFCYANEVRPGKTCNACFLSAQVNPTLGNIEQ